MKTFDYLSELNKLIENKQLTEVYLQGDPTFIVAYILNATAKFVTLAVVGSNATFSGVSIVRFEDIDSVSVQSTYLSELAKQIQNTTIYDQAMQCIKPIATFTFDGLAEGLENTKTIVELTQHNDEVSAGRIAGHDSKILVLDEYSTESDKRLKRTYFNRETIKRFSLGLAWLRTIERFLADKNI